MMAINCSAAAAEHLHGKYKKASMKVFLSPLLLCMKPSVTAAFGDNGNQLQRPLYAKITGSVGGIQALLLRCGWNARRVAEDLHLYELNVLPMPQ